MPLLQLKNNLDANAATCIPAARVSAPRGRISPAWGAMTLGLGFRAVRVGDERTERFQGSLLEGQLHG